MVGETPAADGETSCGVASVGTSNPATSNVATTPRLAHTANTLPTPATVMTTPTSRPDTINPAASSQLTTTLAAVS